MSQDVSGLPLSGSNGSGRLPVRYGLFKARMWHLVRPQLEDGCWASICGAVFCYNPASGLQDQPDSKLARCCFRCVAGLNRSYSRYYLHRPNEKGTDEKGEAQSHG